MVWLMLGHRYIALLAATVVVALSAPVSADLQVAAASDGERSFYLHDAVYNVTANGTTALVLDGTELRCEVSYTITHGETDIHYLEKNAKLRVLPDCSVSLSITDILTSTLGGPTAGTYHMDVLSVTAHGNTMNLRMAWYWAGAIDEYPAPRGLWWKQDSPPWAWVNDECCSYHYWDCPPCGPEISAKAHGEWTKWTWPVLYEWVDMRGVAFYAWPGKSTCEGRTMNTDGLSWPTEAECKVVWYPPGSVVPPWL